MPEKLIIDSYQFTVDEYKLQIENLDGPEQVIDIDFTPLQASQLTCLLNKLIPDNYGVRSSFRIPITSDIGISTTLSDGKRTTIAEITSLSLSGIYAKVPQDIFELNLGSKLNIEMKFGDESVKVRAIVSRYDSKGVGLAFMTQPGSSEEDAISQLVMAVQRTWIARQPG